MTNKLAMCHVCSGFGQVSLGPSMGQPCWECNGMGMVTVKEEFDFLGDAEKWDNRELGASEDHVAVASEAEVAALNDALKEPIKKKTRGKKDD